MVVNAVADGAILSSLAASAAASRSAVGIRMDVFDVSVMSLSSSRPICSTTSGIAMASLYHEGVVPDLMASQPGSDD